MSKKKYVVNITEKMERTIIIEAESEEEAAELVEGLCNDSKIDLTYEDFTHRECEVLNEAAECDFENYVEFEIEED